MGVTFPVGTTTASLVFGLLVEKLSDLPPRSRLQVHGWHARRQRDAAAAAVAPPPATLTVLQPLTPGPAPDLGHHQQVSETHFSSWLPI